MSAHLIPWGTSFNNLPVGTNKVGDTPIFIRQSRQGISERIGQEHNMNLSDTTTDNHGKHLEGSARCFISNAAISTPDVTIDTVYVEGETPDFKNGRQYYDPEKNRFYVYVTDYTYTDSYGNSRTIDGFQEIAATVAQLEVGTCSTEQATATKIATVTNFKLVDGTVFYIKFTYAAVANALLNVNSTGAKAIYVSGAVTTASSWSAGETLKLHYSESASAYVIDERLSASSSDTAFIGSLSGNAETATKLATARTIGGVSFDGTANIDLPGVNTTGNQNTTGNAATATLAANASNAYSCSGNAESATRINGGAQWWGSAENNYTSDRWRTLVYQIINSLAYTPGRTLAASGILIDTNSSEPNTYFIMQITVVNSTTVTFKGMVKSSSGTWSNFDATYNSIDSTGYVGGRLSWG